MQLCQHDLDNDNYSNVSIIQDELTLKQGRSSKNSDGRIDILITYNEHIGIVELKLGELKHNHLSQLEDYLKEKEQILNEFPNIYDRKVTSEPKWIGVLVGSTIDPELASKIKNGYCTPCGVPIAALTVQRYKSSRNEIYISTDIYMSPNRSRDLTQYNFKGNSFNKGRLVLEVMTQYIEDHPDIIVSDLKKIFPKEIQGSLGVFTTQSKAEDIHISTGYKRYFIKPDEVITLHDERIAICTQWGISNIDNFIQIAKQQGYVIENI